jgi:hypothetical protein
MASKRQNAPSEEADSCQVRSNALGAFERTHGRTQEQGPNACPAGPSGYLRSNARDLRSNASPVSPHFPCCPSRPYRTSLQPCAVGSYVRSIAHSAFERTCGRTQRLHTNARSAVMHLRSYAHQNIERMQQCVRTQLPAFERTPDLAARFILSINRT